MARGDALQHPTRALLRVHVHVQVCVPPPTAAGAAADGPCGPLANFSGWSAPRAARLGANGTTVVLSGMATLPAAVRYAWRAYPCEHEGCGLHSAAEGVPPPPFHAWVTKG